MWGVRFALFAGVLGACAPAPEPVGVERFLRVGVQAREEADAVRARLEAAGWALTHEVETPRFVALAFARGDEERAVRVITSRGLAASLDSHEPDGVRRRHGRVTLAEPAARDLDGDGVDELVVSREEEPLPCLAALRFDETGAARALADEAASLREGACVGRYEDVDADGALEAIVRLDWPALSLGEHVAAVEVPLALRDGAFRADGLPAAFAERERARREAALAAARAAREVAQAADLALELAALAHLAGASIARQVERFDEALAGLVLTPHERDRVAAVRAVVAAGWRDVEP
ncbi:MAG: hypothetical protein KF729_28045 [Sandaracinaceae bacterium]|nr:hypothetical protein [Sandaracinaceae bacterium]